jgi:hypothetical protein
MSSKRVWAFIAVLVAGTGAIDCAGSLGDRPPTVSPQKPGASGVDEKTSRTPAQQKINSQLLYEIYRRRGEAARRGVPPDPTGVRMDSKGRALVDIRAEVTPALQKTVTRAGGTIVSTSREYRSILAWIDVLKLEQIAADPTVRAIEPAAEATTAK